MADVRRLARNDRISRLPDSLICEILSYLPSKTAAATTILSKRWKSLWNCVPIIALYEDEVAPMEKSELDFIEIVNNVFLSRKIGCSIKRFILKCARYLWDPNYNDAWIDKAIQHNVQELYLHLAYADLGAYRIPRTLYNYNTLVVLKLSGIDLMMNVPSRVDLPSLKVLHLLYVQYKAHHSICNLLAGCPVLDELFVERGEYDSIYDYEKTAPSVRILVVIILGYVTENLDLRSRINTVHLRNLCSLVEAKLDVYPCRELSEEDYKNSLAVLQAVYNVRFLELLQNIVRALGFTTRIFPAFHNLVRLKLDGFFYYWGVLLKLLLKSPFLEDLSLAKPSPDLCVDEVLERWIHPPSVPTCLSSHLKCLQYGFTGSEDEMKFVSFILENSLVLEKMRIKCCPELDLSKKFSFQQKIQSFGKRSKKCLLEFD